MADLKEQKTQKNRSPQNRRSSGGGKKLRNGADPCIGQATQFKPGQSGNPGGRPKNDLAREIAQAIFENDADAIYKAFREALLKGNAYTFKELAERAYGKVAQAVEVSGPGGSLMRFSELSRDELNWKLVETMKRILAGEPALAKQLRDALERGDRAGGAESNKEGA